MTSTQPRQALSLRPLRRATLFSTIVAVRLVVRTITGVGRKRNSRCGSAQHQRAEVRSRGSPTAAVDPNPSFAGRLINAPCSPSCRDLSCQCGGVHVGLGLTDSGPLMLSADSTKRFITIPANRDGTLLYKTGTHGQEPKRPFEPDLAHQITLMYPDHLIHSAGPRYPLER